MPQLCLSLNYSNGPNGVTFGGLGKICPNAPLRTNSDFHPHRFRHSVRFVRHRIGNKLVDWRRDTPIGTSHGYRRASTQANWPKRMLCSRMLRLSRGALMTALL